MRMFYRMLSTEHSHNKKKTFQELLAKNMMHSLGDCNAKLSVTLLYRVRVSALPPGISCLHYGSWPTHLTLDYYNYLNEIHYYNVRHG
jgi:hypothetical protein